MQKDSAADIELNLKKKARRRLVGAIALVILMIIVLPILLEDRSAVVSHEDVKISIQNKNTLPEEIEATPTLDEFDSSVVSADQNNTEPSETQAESKQPGKSVAIEDDPEVAPAPKPAEASAKKVAELPATNKPPAQYFVQIGVFSDLDNVKQLQTKLSGLGYQSNIEKINTPKGEKIRLRSQVFTSRNEAAIALQNIKASGLTGMVVSQ